MGPFFRPQSNLALACLNFEHVTATKPTRFFVLPPVIEKFGDGLAQRSCFWRAIIGEAVQTSTRMKIIVLFVLAILLCSCLEPVTAQRGKKKVLRMCRKKFKNCLTNKKYKKNFKAGSKCCGRAWTVCQLHRRSCRKICHPSYRKCMCGMGFGYYC